MGLSLTADVVGWVLVDVDAGGLLDHDVLEVTAGAETAGAAVLGAHAIAATAGHEIDRVRITWSDDAAHDGLRLQSRLRSLALSPVEAVPQSRALAVLVDPEDADLPVDIVLAYGAAMAAADSGETMPEPVSDEPVRRSRARRLLTSALGVAAAVALGVFFLGAAGGSLPPRRRSSSPAPPIRVGLRCRWHRRIRSPFRPGKWSLCHPRVPPSPSRCPATTRHHPRLPFPRRRSHRARRL